MRREQIRFGLFFVSLMMSLSVMAQQTTTLSGTVKNSKTQELLSAVSVTVKGGTAGTYTDDKGEFNFSIS
ncbi:MAG TPA: carboxypeptidase-like regulatory domain-containing protein, partial [Sediminibacterium sp.]|nr:carboxypeptidase-like regulatory domain-containing protein [Sediminibacterium sp.]